jgi:hypothetical protein
MEPVKQQWEPAKKSPTPRPARKVTRVAAGPAVYFKRHEFIKGKMAT